jgi:hypothetical protein
MRTRGIAQGGHESLLVGSGVVASSRTVMWWPGVARTTGDLGSVSSPHREGEGRGRLGRVMGRWAGGNRPKKLGKGGDSWAAVEFWHMAD